MQTFEGKIAILSSGPSLTQHWQDTFFDDYDIVIAVNFAGFLFKHHWFSFWEQWVAENPLEAPAFNKTLQRIEPLTGYIVPRPHESNKTCLVMPMLVGASSYTSTEVLRFIIKRATPEAAIHIFGFDLQGEIDCLGRHGGNRDPQRWDKERKYIQTLITDTRVTVHGGIAENGLL